MRSTRHVTPSVRGRPCSSRHSRSITSVTIRPASSARPISRFGRIPDFYASGIKECREPGVPGIPEFVVERQKCALNLTAVRAEQLQVRNAARPTHGPGKFDVHPQQVFGYGVARWEDASDRGRRHDVRRRHCDRCYDRRSGAAIGSWQLRWIKPNIVATTGVERERGSKAHGAARHGIATQHARPGFVDRDTQQTRPLLVGHGCGLDGAQLSGRKAGDPDVRRTARRLIAQNNSWFGRWAARGCMPWRSGGALDRQGTHKPG